MASSAAASESSPVRTSFPDRTSDRTFYLLMVTAIWAVILAGFTPSAIKHVTGKHVAYAPIVYVHICVAVGWLALLTTQIALVRLRRPAVHRRLGLLGFAMVPLLAITGAWAALVMIRLEFPTPDSDAPFLILPLLNVTNFTVVALAGLALRRKPAVHKRLMLLATVLLMDAGFARWLGGPLSKLTGDGVLPFFIQYYTGTVLLILIMAAYDLVTRRKLYPAFVIAALFGVTNEVIVAYVYNLPAWKPVAMHILGV